MSDLSPGAYAYGVERAPRLFNRRGHGKTTTVSERHLCQAEVAALLAIAYQDGLDAGAKMERAKGEKHNDAASSGPLGGIYL